MTIFDIDGTLLPGTSCERLFFNYLIDQRILTFRNLFHFGIKGLMLLPKGRAFALKANKGYLRGMSIEQITKIGKLFFDSVVIERLSKKGIRRLNEHRDNGEIIVLLSGMPEFLLINFAEYLKVENYRGSELQVVSGRITGRTLGEFPLSKGKARIVASIINNLNIPWNEITAYGDHYGDRYLLEKVGRPVAVNPDYGLQEIAREKGWEIETFD